MPLLRVRAATLQVQTEQQLAAFMMIDVVLQDAVVEIVEGIGN